MDNKQSLDIPNISKLHKEKYNIENKKKDIFDIVLKKCIEQIVHTNRHTPTTFIIFDVPKVLIGHPQYDLKECILYIIKELSSKNYIVEFLQPCQLYIDWGSSSDKREPFLSKNAKSEIKHLLEKKYPNAKVEYEIIDKKRKKKK